MTEQITQETAGQAIPIPAVRTDHFDWRKRNWASEPEWPDRPPLVSPLSVVNRVLFSAYVIVFIVAIAFIATRLTTEPAHALDNRGLLTFALVAASVSLIALVLRRFGILVGLSRFLFSAFSFATIGGLTIACVFAFSTSTTVMESFHIVPFLSNWHAYEIAIVGTVLAIVVWLLVNAEVHTFEQRRASFYRAHSRVFPDGRWKQVTGRPSGVLPADAGTLERRTAIAEQLTAPLLDELLLKPGVAIVHRIQYPGSNGAAARLGDSF